MSENTQPASNLSSEQQQALARLAIQKAVAQKSDELYEKYYEKDSSSSPAAKLLTAFRDAEKGMTQVRNLENIAYSTGKLSDIYDFLKKQMGRPGDLGAQWRREGVGQQLLNDLTALRKDAKEIADQVRGKYAAGTGDDTERQVHLMLCREYVKHVAAHYQYASKVRE
jgi:hypothetical protein